MTARVPRQLRAEQRRDALVAAAVSVVSVHGPSAFSARAVATQAHLPLAAVSYYYPQLDDLLARAIEEVLRGWLEHGQAVATATEGRGTGVAARVITEALLPPGPPGAVRNRYEHLMAAARNRATSSAMANLRPGLLAVITRILTGTGIRTPLSPDALLALVDGAAVGAVSEGAEDPRARVESTLREVLSSGSTNGRG